MGHDEKSVGESNFQSKWDEETNIKYPDHYLKRESEFTVRKLERV